MIKPRQISPQEREAAAAVERAYQAMPKSECRPGIRGRCGIPHCPRCDPDDASGSESTKED